MVVMSPNSVLTLSDLPTDYREGAPPPPATSSAPVTQELEAIERTHILATLEAHGGNRTHAAAALRISVRTLQRKLKAWGLENFLHRDSASDTSPVGPTPGL
jgi:DNA-binding NtrC family response regulator